MSWRTIEADGFTWEVRAVSGGATGQSVHEDLLEFRAREGNVPARRVVVPPGTLETLDDMGLAAAFMKARPLGGDHYGRPGKKMRDVQ